MNVDLVFVSYGPKLYNQVLNLGIKRRPVALVSLGDESP